MKCVIKKCHNEAGVENIYNIGLCKLHSESFKIVSKIDSVHNILKDYRKENK